MYRKCKISNNLEVYHSLHFPYSKKSQRKHRYKATVGIGGNVGDVKRRFERLFYFLRRDRRVELLKTSLILKNPPFGYTKQDDFFNSIMILQTSLPPKQFLDYLLRIEKIFGRKRSFANAPRTLDLDMIFFDNLVINTKKLTLPHPCWMERESVLIPLKSLKV